MNYNRHASLLWTLSFSSEEKSCFCHEGPNAISNFSSHFSKMTWFLLHLCVASPPFSSVISLPLLFYFLFLLSLKNKFIAVLSCPLSRWFASFLFWSQMLKMYQTHMHTHTHTHTKTIFLPTHTFTFESIFLTSLNLFQKIIIQAINNLYCSDMC